MAAVVVVYFVFVDDAVAPDGNDSGSDTVNELGIELREVAQGFSAPVDIISTGADGDKRLFIVEQGGVIRILDNGEIKPQAVLDVSQQVVFEGEQGLLGAAFSPELDYLFVNYVRPTSQGRETVIARYELNDNQSLADAGSRQIILSVDQPYANHNGGDLAFGPDGYLYVALGDGGSAGDPQNYAQNQDSLLGKILRLDVANTETYIVPNDNPLVGEDGRDEIWHWGLRNPWRISFDSAGNLWIADVGQNAYEEINRQPAGQSGLNFGWRCFEANADYNQEGCEDASNYTMPVASYAHEGNGCTGSIAGGYVYEGQGYPALSGMYLAADYCTGKLYRLNSNSIETGLTTIRQTELRVTTFGTDSTGELYLADAGSGTIYQITAQ